MIYLILFFSSFLSATLFPFYSEAVLGTYLLQGHSPQLLWITATAGNTLGAILNWIMGRYFLHFQEKKWFPFKALTLKRAQNHFQKYGKVSLLFAWLPVVGDPLTFLAGTLNVSFLPFLLLVGIGKGLRYLAVILLL